MGDPRHEKGISRFERDKRHTPGYQARVRFQGKTQYRFFADHLCGGKKKALTAALNWRNQRERELGILRTNRRWVEKTVRTRTGVAGVRRVKTGYEIALRARITITTQRSRKEAFAEARKLREEIQKVLAQFAL